MDKVRYTQSGTSIRLNREYVPQQIVNQIQELIAGQRLVAGDRLPSERELALQLNVGRSSLREAIKILAGLEIVEVRHGLGTFVREPQLRPLTNLAMVQEADRLALMRQAIEARAFVEIEVARLAAQRATPEDIEALEQYLHLTEIEPLKSKRKYGLDLGFEKVMAKASKNIYLVELQKQVHTMFAQVWSTGGFIPRPAEVRNEQHQELVDAIRTHDASQAAQLMRAHVNMTP